MIEHEVELVDRVIEPVQWRRGIEDESRLAAGIVDVTDRAVDVLGGFRMEADDSGACLREVADDAIDRLHHQVDVDREPSRAA
jgi:hypothetical protein